MPLPTLDTIVEAYLENADYESARSSAKAEAFITACIKLLVMLPRSSGKSGNQTTLAPELVQQQLDHARAWIAANGSTNGTSEQVRHASFQSFRT